MKPSVYVIVGATATGKTQLAIEIAKLTNGEIISADSMQIYREMDIGTAKPTTEERQGIIHHMIDVCKPDYPYSAAEFQRDAIVCLNKIVINNKTPIIVGGSGLYINSLTYDLDFSQQNRNTDFRNSLKEKPTAELYFDLTNIDKAAAQRIHPNNRIRIIRALEIASGVGQRDYNFNKHNNKYNFKFIGLRYERPTLYERINKRVDIMIDKGLQKEVEYLYNKYENVQTAFQGIGYKEFISYFNKESDYATAVEKIKQHSRNLAKRQHTWFKRDDRIEWFDMSEDEVFNIDSILNKFERQNQRS